MSFTSLTESDIQKMLSAIGVDSIDQLFTDLPESIRIQGIEGLPEPLSEMEISEKIAAAGGMNCICRSSFLGAGAYNHYIPAAVDELASRSEFYTAYTPYQPEVSQGTLTAIFEFQTMMSRLTGMDITNASMYDGATALAESVMMSVRSNGLDRILVSRAVHPAYRKVLETYAWAGDFELIEIDTDNCVTDMKQLSGALDDSAGAVVIQSPNFFGAIEDISSAAALTEKGKTNLITVVAEAMSLGMLKGPGALGADIVCGEVQSFGNYLNYGGPFVGYISAKSGFARKMPGRLIGQTEDSEGNRSFALTLQTREQHIRREKATSNICTNQGLLALRSAIYLSITGSRLKDIAGLNHSRAQYLKKKLQEKNAELLFSGPFFNEFAVKHSSMQEASANLKKLDINPGLDLEQYYPEMKNCMLVCATEMNSPESIDEFASCFI